MDDTESASVRWQGPKLRRDQGKARLNRCRRGPRISFVPAGTKAPRTATTAEAGPAETGASPQGIGVVPIATRLW